MRVLLLGSLMLTVISVYAGDVVDGYCGELKSIKRNDENLQLKFELEDSDAISIVENKYSEFKSTLNDRYRSLTGINSYERYISLLTSGDAILKGAELFDKKAYLCFARIIRDDYSRDHYIFTSFQKLLDVKRNLKSHFDL